MKKSRAVNQEWVKRFIKLDNYLKSKGLSPKDLFSLIAFNDDHYYRTKSGKRNPEWGLIINNLHKRFPEVNGDYLITGRGKLKVDKELVAEAAVELKLLELSMKDKMESLRESLLKMQEIASEVRSDQEGSESGKIIQEREILRKENKDLKDQINKYKQITKLKSPQERLLIYMKQLEINEEELISEFTAFLEARKKEKG